MVISKDLLSSFCHKWQRGQQRETSEAVCILFCFSSPHKEERRVCNTHEESTKTSSYLVLANVRNTSET